MGMFSALFRSRDKPENRTAGSSYAFYLGGSTSGKAVTERSAMQMTAVYSCVRILAEAVAGLTSDYWDNILADYSGVLVWLKHNNYLSNADGDRIDCWIGHYDFLNNFFPEDGYTGWVIGYKENGTADREGNLYIQVRDWSNAQPGESYSVKITYRSNLVSKG